MNNMKQMYRYEEYGDERGTYIHLIKFIVVRETPAGFWVINEGCVNYDQGFIEKHKRLVKKGAVRSYCYETKSQAMSSFYIRKSKHLTHLERKAKTLNLVLNKLEEIDFASVDVSPEKYLTPCGSNEAPFTLRLAK